MTRATLLLKLSLRNVFRNRRRSLYALGTIAVGAMGLFVFMGFNRGLMDQYRANTIRARWGYGQVYVQGYRGRAHTAPWEQWIERPGEIMERLRAAPGVVDLFPRLTIHAMLVAGGQTVAGQGEGIDGVAEARFFDQLNYVEGGDLKDHPAGLVLGQGLAQGLGVHVNDQVMLRAQDGKLAVRSAKVTVTGVFHTGSQEFDSRAFRIPLSIAQALLGTDRVESISVALIGLDAWPAFAQAVQTILPHLEAVPFDELDRVYYRHAVDWLDAQFGFIRGIILLVVFLGIFNVISMAVMERTAEIGTLRANGDGRLEIALGQALEAAALGVLGGAQGLLAGWALSIGPLRDGIAMPPAPGITRSFRILIELRAQDAWQVLGLCTLTAVVGCLLPVWRATRIPVAEALRHA
jgi:putative ABC transport system permease protein